MNLTTSLPRGTYDILPSQVNKWQYLEGEIRSLMRLYGFGEIRTPVFEHTELFQRGVGDTTDVVQKEMYTFTDKGGRSITLKPEGTAPVVRALLENGLYAEAMPQKLYYITNCYRYEKPQAGRTREFTQFGTEVFGADSPAADAELISIPYTFYKRLGIEDKIELHLNSIGCPECRKVYHDSLKKYFNDKTDKLCDTCKGRLEKNPMRILDCKCPTCQEIAKDAPRMLDYICDDCHTHFESLKCRLDDMGIKYQIDTGIVRGLDYYTKTVFEFVCNSIGAQGTVCGGGRYDGLCQELGGVKLSGLGFGMGMTRLIAVLENAGFEFPQPAHPQIYIASIGERASRVALQLTSQLRDGGIAAECDIVGRSLKAQMKYADKIHAEYTVVLGDDECESKVCKLRNMATGDSEETMLECIKDILNR